VAGPCQLFRRRCFEEVGGYVPIRAGGVDWVAVMTARMKGRRTRSFQEMRFNHHQVLETASALHLMSVWATRGQAAPHTPHGATLAAKCSLQRPCRRGFQTRT
jgi:hypothetical protein